MGTIMKYLFPVVVFAVLTFGVSTVPAETIKIACEEYVRITGEKMSCDVTPNLTIEKSQYEAAVRKAQVRTCRKNVHAKYPGVDCQPMRLYDDKETAAHRCFSELQECDRLGGKKEKIEKKESVKLW